VANVPWIQDDLAPAGLSRRIPTAPQDLIGGAVIDEEMFGLGGASFSSNTQARSISPGSSIAPLRFN
jgi:hypothetical protein